MIATQRLTLRRFTPADEPAYATVMTNPSVYGMLGFGKEITSDMIPGIIQSHESAWGHGLGVYAVIENISGKLIGHCGIRGLPCGRKEILYALAESAWGKGYATEAAKAVLQSHPARPLIALSYPTNAASINIIKKLGFRHIGQEIIFGTKLESFILE
ncbi:MAG: GNAT family N-acetyltransferase [Defluviitaleaceae bacterium]|nr:GNAT family N-acetyltransferase [Defluviitaleaceae bacterium]